TFCRCGSGILLNRLLESSLIFRGFIEALTGLFALPLALSMWRIIGSEIGLARLISHNIRICSSTVH
ncbi:hypothetical protein, partial [Aeromonas encheleia]|uniref:hypothetical protein n=1 Tax=Aeromonas encheleia TaxID=73010 RepID=UPI001E2D3607